MNDPVFWFCLITIGPKTFQKNYLKQIKLNKMKTLNQKLFIVLKVQLNRFVFGIDKKFRIRIGFLDRSVDSHFFINLNERNFNNTLILKNNFKCFLYSAVCFLRVF